MSREERICWEHINKLMFTSYCFMACMVQEIRDFRIGWYLESNSVWNLKSEQDKAAKRKESFRTLRAGSWWDVSKVAWSEGRRMLNKCGKRT